MLGGNRFGEQDRAVGGLLVLEMVVQGRHAPHAVADTRALLGVTEPETLDDDGQALGEEYAAQQRNQQFLAHQHGAHADDAADGEAARVAHEYLGGEGIEPEEADEGAHEGAHEDGNLSGSGNIHDIEEVRVDEVTTQPGYDTQYHAYDGRCARRQAVQAVGEVGAVGAGGDHKHDHEHVDGPFGVPAPGALDRRQPAVVELVVLDEGDGGLGALDHIFLYIAAAGDGGLCLERALDAFLHFHLFADDDVRAGPHGEADDEAQDDLADELSLLAHAFLLVAEHLDVVVGEADGAAPERAHQQQDDVDVGEVAEQQHAAEDGQDDDDAAHRRGALLLDLVGQAEVADGLSDLFFLEQGDDALAGDHGHQHRRHRRHHGAEAQVVHQSQAGEVGSDGLQVLEQVVNHCRMSLKVSSTISFSSKCDFSWPMIW